MFHIQEIINGYMKEGKKYKFSSYLIENQKKQMSIRGDSSLLKNENPSIDCRTVKKEMGQPISVRNFWEKFTREKYL